MTEEPAAASPEPNPDSVKLQETLDFALERFPGGAIVIGVGLGGDLSVNAAKLNGLGALALLTVVLSQWVSRFGAPVVIAPIDPRRGVIQPGPRGLAR